MEFVAPGVWYSAPSAVAKPQNSSGGSSLVTIDKVGCEGWGGPVYGGSDVENSTSDFLGDWRSVDSWQRFDLWRVRNRSRQLERGNETCRAYKRHMINNVLGHKGFHQKISVVSSKIFGDAVEGVIDENAIALIKAALEKQGKKANLTTRKRLSRKGLDALLLSRLIFDGEFILQKRPGFNNDCRFAWQTINPDYLDHNLNRLEPNGNMTRMGVELDKVDKFPVAYWFLLRRPNDSQYNWNDPVSQRYVRVDAADVIHCFVQTEDEEQTRGFPWVFSAMINLFRSGKFKEAALINATIGASKGLVYEKAYPEGFTDPLSDMAQLARDDTGYLVDKIQPASGYELPYGVTAKQIDYRFPDAAINPFLQAMSLATSLAFGTSYATTTGDLSQANFVSSRIGQNEEREMYMSVQEFLIEEWKKPAFEEELYRGMLSRNIPLPVAKLDKFNTSDFTGRRWPFVQPVQDLQAKVMALDSCLTSISDIIRETSQEDPEEVFKRIKADNDLLKKYELARVHSTFQFIDPEDDGSAPPAVTPGQSDPAAPSDPLGLPPSSASPNPKPKAPPKSSARNAVTT